MIQLILAVYYIPDKYLYMNYEAPARIPKVLILSINFYSATSALRFRAKKIYLGHSEVPDGISQQNGVGAIFVVLKVAQMALQGHVFVKRVNDRIFVPCAEI